MVQIIRSQSKSLNMDVCAKECVGGIPRNSWMFQTWVFNPTIRLNLLNVKERNGRRGIAAEPKSSLFSVCSRQQGQQTNEISSHTERLRLKNYFFPTQTEKRPTRVVKQRIILSKEENTRFTCIKKRFR